jgi:tetratricopeptide (TPR) repeat protein
LKLGILAESILVGRDPELEELNVALNSTIEGKGSTIFISGEAGCGKTRITNEFLEIARKKGATILTGWCLSNAAVPYFPFVEAFESFFAENEGDRPINSQQLGVKTWLMAASKPEREVQEGLSFQSWKEQEFAAVTKELMFLSTEKPLIMFIDDLHWADSASLSLLHYISRAIASERILVLATFRSEELGPNAEGFVNPLLDTLRLMRREDLFKELKLLNLSQQDVGRIVESMLGGKVNQEVAEKLSNESRGNPLFVIESVRMLFENSSFIQQGDQWQLAVDKLGIPTKVKEIILRRLDALKPFQRRILDVASIIGDRFDPQLLGSVLNQDSLEILETLNSIALSKSLVCVEGDYYRFDHAKSREVLYEEILLPLKKGYHERVAERLESLNHDAKKLPITDLAYHYTQAGNKAKSIEYNLLAGKAALSRFGNTEAIRHFRYVVENTAELPDYLNERTNALEGLGSALVESGLQSESIQIFEQLYDTSQSDLTRLRALRKALQAATYQGDLAAVQRLATKAEGIPPVDRLEHARLRLYIATANVFGERRIEAIANAEAALQVFEEEYSIHDVGYALIEAGITYGKVGRLEESIAAGLRSKAILKDADNLTKVLVYGHLSYDFLASGLFQQAIDTASEGIRIGEKIDNSRIAWLYFFSAGAHEFLAGLNAAIGRTLEAGQYLATAIDLNMKGAQIAEKTDGYYILTAIYISLSREYISLGNIKKAEEYVERFVKLRGKFGPNMEKALFPEILGVTAALHTAKGQWEEANNCHEILFAYQNNKSFSIFDAAQHLSYAKDLFTQRRLVEAQGHFERGQAMMTEITVKFEHAKVKATLLASLTVEYNRPFEVILDLVNISKKPANLIKIDKVRSPNFKVFFASAGYILNDGTIEFSNTVIEPFSVNSIKLSFQAIGAGRTKLEPNIVYKDDLGQTEICRPKPIDLTITPTQLNSNLEPSAEANRAKIEFKSEITRKVSDYLIAAFKEDYVRRRMLLERSGWRTLNQIANYGKVSKHSVYGSSGRRGQAISELERCGIVEERAFTGERGRGGNILKIRIAFEEEAAKKLINREIGK